ncbi:MAG: hypothetical protein Kow009_10280 [Spirochaetales bacterium]
MVRRNSHSGFSLLVVGVLLLLFLPFSLAADTSEQGADTPEQGIEGTDTTATEAGFSLFEEGSTATGPTWSGRVWANSRLYLDKDETWDSAWDTIPRTDLSLETGSDEAELKVKFRWDPAWQTQGSTPLFQRMIDEAYVRGFLGSTVLEAGYMKVVWGKGDDIHVLDVLNATDYYDFVNNEYLERRVSEWMVRIAQPLGEMHSLELVWEPVTTPDRIPFEGKWKPYAISALEAQVSTLIGSSVTASALMAQDNLVQEDLSTLADGTYGVRFTGSSHGFDYGILYAYTYNRQPKVEVRGLQSPSPQVFLVYDRVHCFGIEGSTAWQGFTFRWEGGYFLTGDTDGTDPEVRNNSVGYVVGFDRDLWTDGANLNLQLQGLVPLHTDEIDSNPMDVEYRSDGTYTNHILAGRLSGTILENKVEIKLSAAYGLEHQDLRIAPELLYKPFDDFEITGRWVQYVGDADTTFGQFEDSSFLEIGVNYRF